MVNETINEDEVKFDKHTRRFVRTIRQRGEVLLAPGLPLQRSMTETQNFTMPVFKATRKQVKDQLRNFKREQENWQTELNKLGKPTKDPEMDKYLKMIDKLNKLKQRPDFMKKVEDLQKRSKANEQLNYFSYHASVIAKQVEAIDKAWEEAKSSGDEEAVEEPEETTPQAVSIEEPKKVE